MKKLLAKKLLKKYNPTVVFIGGSWGKSMSAQIIEALFLKLDKNVEIADARKGIHSIIASGRGNYSLIKSLLSLFSLRSYPEVIIIKLYSDPGITTDLLKTIENKYLVIPYITHKDIAEYGDLQKFLLKRCFIRKNVAKEFSIIYNADVSGLSEIIEEYDFKEQISYAIESDNVSYLASSIKYKQPADAHLINDSRVQGVTLKIQNGGSTLPFVINGGVGKQHIYAVLSAISLSKTMGLNLVDSIAALRGYKLLPGRMSLIPGVKKSLLIDDSYDIDEESAILSFYESSLIPVEDESKKIAIIGGLHNAGHKSESVHCMLGESLVEMGYDMVVGIGERTSDLIKCAQKASAEKSRFYHFNDKEEAGKFVQHEMKKGDLVVIKGAKEDNFEIIVKELMAFPLRSKEDLIQRDK